MVGDAFKNFAVCLRVKDELRPILGALLEGDSETIRVKCFRGVEVVLVGDVKDSGRGDFKEHGFIAMVLRAMIVEVADEFRGKVSLMEGSARNRADELPTNQADRETAGDGDILAERAFRVMVFVHEIAEFNGEINEFQSNVHRGEFLKIRRQQEELPFLPVFVVENTYFSRV